MSSAGIFIADNSNFFDDVVNASGGVISALGFGIEFSEQTFAGTLSNGGKITARTGIAVLGGSIINGAVVDTGAIVATSHSILVERI